MQLPQLLDVQVKPPGNAAAAEGGPGQGPGVFDAGFLRRLELLDIVAKKLLGGGQRGERRSAKKGPGLEFSDHRPYAAGDDPRYIDWNVYSRLNELELKRFDLEENRNLAVFVDCSPSMDFGRFNKLAAAVKVAAAIGYVGLSHFDRVFLFAGGAPPGPKRGVYAGKQARREFLGHAASIRPSPDGGAIDRFAREASALFRSPSAAVAVSDFYEPEAKAAALRVLAGGRFVAAAIHVVDPSERSPRLEGRASLADAETGRILPLTVTRSTREAYSRRFEAHLNRVRHILSSGGVGCTIMETSSDFEPAIVDVLGKGYLFRRQP